MLAKMRRVSSALDNRHKRAPSPPKRTSTDSRSSLARSAQLSTPIPSSSVDRASEDRKSTRLNSSHSQISYAVFCLKKKKCEQYRSPNLECRNKERAPIIDLTIDLILNSTYLATQQRLPGRRMGR